MRRVTRGRGSLPALVISGGAAESFLNDLLQEVFERAAKRFRGSSRSATSALSSHASAAQRRQRRVRAGVGVQDWTTLLSTKDWNACVGLNAIRVGLVNEDAGWRRVVSTAPASLTWQRGEAMPRRARKQSIYAALLVPTLNNPGSHVEGTASCCPVCSGARRLFHPCQPRPPAGMQVAGSSPTAPCEQHSAVHKAAAGLNCPPMSV